MFKRVIQFYRQHGLRKLLLRSAAQLGFRRRHEVFVFLGLDLATFVDDFDESPAFQAVSAKDIQDTPDYFDGWFRAKEAIARLRRGHLLFGLRREGRLAAFVWCEKRPEPFRLFDTRFELPADTVYMSGAYTVPEARQQGLNFEAARQTMRHLKRLGIKRAFTLVRPWNEASLGLNAKVGFRPYQTVTYDRLWLRRNFHVAPSDGGPARDLPGWVGGGKRVWDA